MKNLSLLQQLQQYAEDNPTVESVPCLVKEHTLELQVYILEDSHGTRKVGVPLENTSKFDDMLTKTSIADILENLSDFSAILLDV